MPILTVTGGATVREGEKAIFTVSLTSVLTQDVWFRASTITSAGASSADGDYDAILDKLYFIPAGSRKINISVQTYNAGTQNEGLEGVGLWVDEVYHYDVSIGGNGKDYVTILDTIPPIELSVRNTSGNEGNKIGFIVEAESPVLYDTTVYLQVQGTTTAGIASGNWWVAGLIKSGQTSTTVNISTIDDGQSGNRRIDVKLFSYYEEVVMLDDTAYGTVYDTTPNQLPILDIFAGGDVNEGQETISYARLSFAVNYDVTFQVSTWLGEASGDANRNPDSPDYEYLLNKTFTIYAGTTTTPIPVQTLLNNDPTDWAQEVFSIRVEPGSVSGAILGQVRADILIKDVVETMPPEPDLSAFQHLIDTLVTHEGVSGAAAIIIESNTLSMMAQSLEVRGLLADGVWEATGLGAIGGDEGYFLSLNWWPSVLAFVAKSAYKAATGQEMFDEISYGEIINNSGAVAPKNMSYSSEQIAYEGNSILKPGDMVDGRLVIHQPVVAFDTAGNLVKYSSYQGRYDPEKVSVAASSKTDNVSHWGVNSQSFDWSGSVADTIYVVAPFDGYIVYSTDLHASKVSANGGLGNVVTLRAEQKTPDGKEVFVTFAHLKEGSVPDNFITSPKANAKTDTSVPVKAGQVIGVVGDTGGNWPVHLHMLAGNDFSLYGTLTAKAELIDGQIATPPVFMLFGGAEISTRSELNSGIRERGSSFEQDIGFPIGDKDDSSGPYKETGLLNDEPLVVSGISSTFTKEEFYAINPTIGNGGTGGDFPIPDPIWTGTAAAETNAYWEGKVSNVNEFINAGAGYDFILASGGDDVIDGQTDGGQVNIIGNGAIRANFAFTQMADGGVQAISLDGSFGTDRYYNIDGVWFDGQGNIPGDWYNLADLLINTQNDGDGIAPTETWQTFDELFPGTALDDFIRGGTGIDWFTATTGNDFIFGGDGQSDDPNWNQVNFNITPFGEIVWGYDSTSDLLFSNHADLGRDVYDKDITDFWFDIGSEWHGRAELIGLATTSFEFV